MANVAIPFNPPQSGTQNVDFAQESTTNSLRQILTVGDPTNKTGQAAVKNSDPGDAEYGLVTRTLIPVTKPAAVQGTVADAAVASGNPIPVGGIYNSAAPTYTNGQRATAQFDANGNLKVAPITNGPTVGNVASGATDSGNPVKVGSKYNASAPTVTDGQRVDDQADANGNKKVTLATALQGLISGVETDSILNYIGRRADAWQAAINFASSSAQTIKAGTASKNTYITELSISCDGGAACNVIIQDSAGTPNILIPKTYFGTTPQTIVYKFATPLQVATANDLKALCSSATPNISVCASGYQM